MKTVHRLRLAGAGILLAGAIVGTQVWGDSSGKRAAPMQPPSSRKDVGEVKLGDGLAGGKFAQFPIVSYTTTKGETIIGAQIKPALEVPAARPRDLAILVDASASQAGAAFDTARKIVKALSDSLNANDQVSVWFVTTPNESKRITGDGFVSPKSDALNSAVNKLENELYPSGAVDLKHAMKLALDSFDVRAGRQAAIILLGDGESAFNPVASAERYQIAQDMVARQVAFFAVPLGVRLNPANLHGFASSTGGLVVRQVPEETPVDLTRRMLNTIAGPILYPTGYELADGTLEALPTKLPPLRSDTPTLMVAKVKPGTQELALTVNGTVAGAPAQTTIREKIAASEIDNFFLVGMFDQWSKSGTKAAPALIRADRAMAYALQQSRLAVEEYVTQAQWALADNRIDVAERLYNLALKLNPDDMEAQAGLEVSGKLKNGTATQKQMLQTVLAQKKGEALKIQKNATKAERMNFAKLLATANDQDEVPSRPAGPAAPPPPGNNQDLLQLAQQQRQLLEQQIQGVVEETIRRTKAILSSDPDGAYDLLKRQKSSLVDNPELSEKFRQSMVGRLDSQMRDVENRGRIIKQRLAEEMERRIIAERQRQAAAELIGVQEKTRERVRAFVTLMNQARYEEAHKEALVLQQEHIARGLPVPVESNASYAMSLTATNLRELQELKRIREERFLLTMMQVEKSHVPYPDEPPVHFPPATVWKQLSDFRKERYDVQGLGPETPQRTKELSRRLSQVVDIERPIDASLKDVLEFLSDRFDLTIVVDPAAFKLSEPPLDNVEETKVKLPKLPGVTLSTVLRLVLSPIGGTYLVRRDYIEITTAKEAIKEKAVRAYEVADLVVPIPNSVNQFGLGQNLAVLGGAFSFGAAGNPFGFTGGIGGALGLGALGAGALGIGALGGGALGIGGAAGGALGAAGGGLGLGGQQGNIGFGQGGNNLGAGGGVTGFGGGQLGQFGNLGGQFGLQGGDQSAILVQLITDVVARGEWARLPASTQQQLGQNPGMGEEDTPSVIPPTELNSLGYYPPARALVVRATSRVHTRPGGSLLNPRPPVMGRAPNGRDRDVLVFGGPKLQQDDKAKVLDDNKGKPLAQAELQKVYENTKPNKIIRAKDWQEGFAKAKVKDKAGWVIAIAQFMSEVHEFGQAADVLRTNLRQGFVKEPWVFEALAIALTESGAKGDELERAKLSCIDLEPKDPQSYLRAAEAMAEAKEYDRAVKFCRQASSLQPEMPDPYANALAYAGKLKEVDSDTTAWAVTNLLRRDWSADSDRFHSQARSAIEDVKVKVAGTNRADVAAKIQDAVAAQKRRDLVIELRWQEDADLDLRVVEPIGTVCSSSVRQTPAGSDLRSDILNPDPNNKEANKGRKEVYTVSEAYNGTYEVKVDRVWGRPLGGKAQIKVIRHQGTADEQVEYHTVNVDKAESIKVPLTGGRRTTLALVAPPVMKGHPDKESVGSNMDLAVQRLRALADPNFAGTQTTLRNGGVGGSGNRVDPVYDLSGPKPTGGMTALVTVDSDGTDLTAQTSVKTNKNGDTEIRVKVAPLYETAKNLTGTPVVDNPLIPGSK